MANSNFSPIGVISFPHLFVPKAASPGADERFSLVLIFDAAAQKTPEYKAMKKAAMDAAVAKWGNKAEGMIKNGQIKMPFRDAGEKSHLGGFKDGDVFVSPWSKQKPDVLDGRLQDVVASDCYPGMLGRITYNAFAYDTSGNKGVSIGLNNVQITSFKSERIDNRRKGRDEFDAVDGDEDDNNTRGDRGDKNEDEEFPF